MMELSGGARQWLDVRGGRSRCEHSESDSDSVDLYEDPEEVPVEGPQEGDASRRKASAVVQTESSLHITDAFIRSASKYEAIKEIFTPRNAVKSRTGEVMLKQQKGTFKHYRSIDLDAEELDAAGYMPESPNQTHDDRLHFAQKLAKGACNHRCGDAECRDMCRVRAFVVVEGLGTNFFFGSYEEVVESVRDSDTCEVYVWDDLPTDSMPTLRRMLDRVLESAPRLAMGFLFSF